MAKGDLVIDRDVNSWKVSLTKLDGIPEGAGPGSSGKDSVRFQNDLANLWIGLNANK